MRARIVLVAVAALAFAGAARATSQSPPQDAAAAQALLKDPRFEAARQKHARGDMEGARKDFASLCALAPQNGWLALGVTDFLVQRQDFAGAEPFARKAFELLPDQPPAHHLLGAVLLFTDRTEDAEKLYRAAAQRFQGNPNAANLVFGAGMSCAMNRKYLEAAEWYERALKLDPENSLYHFSTGENCLNLDRLDDAETHFRKAAGGRPRHADASWKLAAVLARQHRDIEAEKLFRAALDEGPPASRWHAGFELGIFLFERGRAAEAAPLLDQATKARPNERMPWHWLARTLRALGRPDEAAAALKHYDELRTKSDRAETDYLLSLIREQLSGAAPVPDKPGGRGDR